MTALAGLFASAFLAATILPFSSEAVLAALATAEGADVPLLWAVASVGNTAGSAANWGLGRFALRWRERRWFPVKPATLDRARERFLRYGAWTLLFAWVPVVGDPLTMAAGLLRMNFWAFLVLVAIGKAGRYAAVLVLAERLLPA
ncbi:MAG: DedA family protein [Inquilinus sp.]|nr:DedA family protein [Inquilinus sp.]